MNLDELKNTYISTSQNYIRIANLQATYLDEVLQQNGGTTDGAR